jgi:hypothetical protein
MAKRRKIRDEEDARACLKAAEEAGGDVRAWARAAGVDGRSLNTWRMNIARRDKSGTRRAGTASSLAGRSAPLQLVELVPAPPLCPRARYVLRVGDVELELDDGFRDETLRRLVGVLRSC